MKQIGMQIIYRSIKYYEINLWTYTEQFFTL